MASVRRTALIAALSGAWVSAVSAVPGPAVAQAGDSFAVVKSGGPPARLLVLGLGDRERACGSADLPAGSAMLRFAAGDAGCGSITQFVVIVRANRSDADTFLGEWCEAIVPRGGTLRLEPVVGDPAMDRMECVLSAPRSD